MRQRSSKELAKRLRFDHFPRSDRVQRWYFAVSLVAIIAGLGLWQSLDQRVGQRLYSPGPVQASHATFGDRCQRCHSGFRAVKNDACTECHALGSHSELETSVPECLSCHMEHRGPQDLHAIGARACVECHGNLASKRPASIETAVGSFASHPQFAPLRGRGDLAAVRFNHRLHLSSTKVPAADKLACASCHQPAADGGLMQPIRFATHCQRCHRQQPPNPFGAIEAPHAAPEAIRAALQAQLLTIAAEAPDRIFAPRPSNLPGVAPRAPLAAAATLRDFNAEWRARLEAALYQPFDPTSPLLEHNHYCFLCHVESGSRADSATVPQPLAVLEETKIPGRWLQRGGFAHRAHDRLACSTCHAAVEQSEQTSDVNLPGKEVCQRCHVDGVRQSAGTQCSLCHLYHDTSKHPELRKAPPVTFELLTGQ